MPTEFSIISILPRTTWRNARSAMAAKRSSRRLMLRMPYVARDRPLSRQEESRSSRRRKARWRAPLARGERIQRPVADRSGGAGQEPGNAELGTPPQVAWAATGKSVVLSREGGAAPAAVAARGAPDRAPYRAVFLSAEPDQGHERGHRDLRALPDHEPVA